MGWFRLRQKRQIFAGARKRMEPPDRQRGEACPAAVASVRRRIARPRLYLSLSTRDPRERWAIQSRSGVVGTCVCSGGRRNARLRGFPDDQPPPPHLHPRGNEPLSSRALRCRGRYLHRGCPPRPWRLELVHRSGRLDMAAWRRRDARFASARGQSRNPTGIARGLARIFRPIGARRWDDRSDRRGLR